MIKYKNFEFGREDQYNVNLYQWQEREVLDLGERTFGKGKSTGIFKPKLMFIGYFGSIQAVLFKIALMDLEETEVKDFNKKLEEHKVFCENLFKKLTLEREERNNLNEESEEK